ncbi:translation elongation factor 4 [Deinococcus sp. LM3]|uniref:translation elongation factor 4 n=1 Tax=unclassified Deinococcus TaxID=2623546 RepID=UPI000992E260|nr:translation elongation factor 4 [Deinococcus sp. LM3]MBX8463886.1 translation elongation factor 4 [Deinococcus sp. RIT780]MCD0161749.1 elongation factor 4 [Deinococcus sp. 6YEL10]MCD0165722.1 elongation factor 4 [Deinococcus sp. 12RED42]OOV15533.1 elongation factor 4 [Deinococcus sp. LM3]
MNVRNFSIIAHVDHGKSTLADRIMERLGAMTERDKRDQTLDTLELERERGITIKSTPVRLQYTRPAQEDGSGGETYTFNLIDTPGHVDFNYEVSRSLAACEGVLLLVDASQGVEAQTIVNAYLAIDNNLEIVPVINKIDLPAADPEGAAQELEEVIGIPAEDAVFASGKSGIGITEILEAIVDRIPSPSGDPEAPLKALIFDSFFDAYQGVILFVRVLEGTLTPKDQIRLMNAGKNFEVDKVGTFSPGLVVGDSLPAGSVGWVAAGIKDIQDAQVGDTLTGRERQTPEAFPGFKPAQPVVFSGLYPTDTEDYRKLRDALEKLKLNDAAFSFEPETSEALGFGFRCGFLGLLHAEIIQERLEREYDLDLIATAPAVVYRVTLTNGDVFETQNPAEFPTRDRIELVEEPYIKLSIMLPEEHVGPVMQLLQERRGSMITMNYVGKRVELLYEVPFAEILYDFHDRLKSISRGYASMDYEQLGYREGDLRKVDIMVNNEVIDALAVIVHETKTYSLGRKIVDKMAEVIPRQMFPVPVQAVIGAKIIARATVKAFRKDVLAKCYGGDISRKKKLLNKQKKGRARMKQFGTVEVPQEAFLAVLSTDE